MIEQKVNSEFRVYMSEGTHQNSKISFVLFEILVPTGFEVLLNEIHVIASLFSSLDSDSLLSINCLTYF